MKFQNHAALIRTAIDSCSRSRKKSSRKQQLASARFLVNSAGFSDQTLLYYFIFPRNSIIKWSHFSATSHLRIGRKVYWVKKINIDHSLSFILFYCIFVSSIAVLPEGPQVINPEPIKLYFSTTLFENHPFEVMPNRQNYLQK